MLTIGRNKKKGGGIQAIGTLSALHIGEKIIIVGLFVQIVFFGIFIVVAGSFHLCLIRHNKQKQITPRTTVVHWRKHLYVLYAASGLIMVRSIFRVVEYLMGNDGYLLRHEYYLYVFDATLMVAVMVLFNVVHPSELTRVYNDGNGVVLLGEMSTARNSSFSSGQSVRSLA